MSGQTTIKNFWMIFLASLALLLIVMAIATTTLNVRTTDDGGVQASFPANTPLNPPPQPAPWHERAISWLIGFVLAAILSGRFILLLGVLLFYGFIISYIAPNAWQRIKGRVWGKTPPVQAKKVVAPRDQK